MKTSFFTAMGLLALAGLGAAGPVAKENSGRPRPQGFENEEVQRPPPGGGRGGDRSRLAGVQPQQQVLYYCMNGQQGDVGQACQQCGGTAVEDQSCSPATQGCKGVTPECYTDQKCQQEYGQQAKVQQCGKQSSDSFQNDQLLSTNQNQERGSGMGSENNMEG
ncbi:hypothetical protein HDK64DRAFT_63430 [Phyllosticta capitalensis]